MNIIKFYLNWPSNNFVTFYRLGKQYHLNNCKKKYALKYFASTIN